MDSAVFKKIQSKDTNMNLETLHNKRSHSQFFIVSYIL